MHYCEGEIGIDENDPAYWAIMAFSLQHDTKPEKAEKYYKKALECRACTTSPQSQP
ncbi:MAG: hypothetical protein ACHQ1D_02780 [Nitrososphaerales archaeon]